MSIMKLAGLVCGALFAALVGGCSGSATSNICARAVECEYIKTGDRAECESDLNKAITDGVVTSEAVATCNQCAHDNACGTDITVDCAKDCPLALTLLIAASQIH